ncbi:MAG: alpha/beta hydrolase [Tumebacillaceae bacterium]
MAHTSSLVTIPNFPSSHLQNTRDLRVYLPPSYASEPERRYPVLYMHDGQNVFHPAPLSGVAWDAHETADRLISSGEIQEIIIVGIDNTEDRMSEYIHRAGTGKYAEHQNKGQLYEQFLTTEVKPYIDTHFRTKCDRENTALLGASLGGLVSFYIGFHHPDLFSKIGIMSPSFWWADRSVLEEINRGDFPQQHAFKIWIDVGDAETSAVPNHVVDDAQNVVDALQHIGYRRDEELKFHIGHGDKHSETAWRDRLHLPLQYFFGTKR